METNTPDLLDLIRRAWRLIPSETMIDPAFAEEHAAWHLEANAVLRALEGQHPATTAIVMPLKSWSLQRIGDGITVQHLPSGAGYWAKRNGESGIAEAVLHLLADDLLTSNSEGQPEESTGKESLAVDASAYFSVVMPDDEGSPAQKSFWAGFESARLSPANSNIRTAWNEFKKSESFALLTHSPDAQQSRAARDVLAERQRQINVEGYHGIRDSHYISYELSKAARAYIEVSWHALSNGPPCAKPKSWPWIDGFKWSDGRTMLVKAGALILAEIERLDRVAQRTGGAE